MPEINGLDVRTVLLEVIAEQTPKGPGGTNLQATTTLKQVAQRLGLSHDVVREQVVLTEWQELFRIGYLAWGYNLANPNPPFFHVTGFGQAAVEYLSRDPTNPAGYMSHLHEAGEVDAIAASYISEALACFNSGSYKAAAVMLGAGSERVVLDLRDSVLRKLEGNGQTVPADLRDWRIRRIITGLNAYFDGIKSGFERLVREEYEAYWPAFTQQIRAIRNEAGHPVSIDPISRDAVHASFLVFPELVGLATRLKAVVSQT